MVPQFLATVLVLPLMEILLLKHNHGKLERNSADQLTQLFLGVDRSVLTKYQKTEFL